MDAEGSGAEGFFERVRRVCGGERWERGGYWTEGSFSGVRSPITTAAAEHTSLRKLLPRSGDPG